LLSFSSHAECSDPSYAKLRPPKYPPEALAARAQGSVLLNVTVGIDGLPQELRIRTSSGNADLDQAAVESVSTWQFNPRRCDGKPELAIAVVPVTFDLSEMAPPETVGDAIEQKPPEAGAPILSEVGREVAHDLKAMPLQTVPEMLRFLKNDPSVMTSRAENPIDSTTTLSLYFSPADRADWQVVESTGNGWSVVDGGWTSIIRTRFLESGRTTWELYSQLCNGSAEWCGQVQRVYLQQMKEMPPPIPPPAPRSTERPKN
jgi:TonB family protein